MEQAQLEQQRLREAEYERQRQLELQRQREMELQRQRELEMARLQDMERKRIEEENMRLMQQQAAQNASMEAQLYQSRLFEAQNQLEQLRNQSYRDKEEYMNVR